MPIFFDLADRSFPLLPESIGNHWAQEDVFRPKGYPFYHWLQTESGCGRIRIGDIEILLSEGEGLFLAPLTPHAYFRVSDGWTTAFVTISGKLESDIHKIIGSKVYLHVDAKRSAAHQKWIDRVIDAHQQRQLDGMQVSCDCYAFLLSLRESHIEQGGTEHPLYRQYVMPAIQEVEARYGESVTAQSLAAARFVSPQYLSRLFRRFLGCSVYGYLTNYRINKAKALLVNQPMQDVQQVAYSVGYGDASHFIAMFRQKTGYTPSAFRKLHIG